MMIRGVPRCAIFFYIDVSSLNTARRCLTYQVQLQHSAQLDIIITNRVGEVAKTLKV